MWQNSTILASHRHASRDVAALIYWVACGRCWPPSRANDTAVWVPSVNTGRILSDTKLCFSADELESSFLSFSVFLFLFRSREKGLNSFGRHESFETFGPLLRKPPKRVIRSPVASASRVLSHPRKAPSVYFVSAVYDILLYIGTYIRRVVDLQFKFVFLFLHTIAPDIKFHVSSFFIGV